MMKRKCISISTPLKTVSYLILFVIYFLCDFEVNAQSYIKTSRNPFEFTKSEKKKFKKIVGMRKDGTKIDSSKEGSYPTINYTLFSKDISKLDNLKKKKEGLLKEIENENDNVEEKKLRDQYNKLGESIDSLVNHKDSLYIEYVKDYLLIKNFTIGFWSSRSLALSKIIFNEEDKGFELLNSTGFNIGENTGSVYTELASGQLYPVKVSIGTMISNSNADSTEERTTKEAYQRLITYGGNTVLRVEYPFIYAHTNKNQATFLTRLISKGSADFPSFGSTSDDWAGSIAFGVDFYGEAATINNEIKFFVNYNVSQYYGTKLFKENLSIPNDKFSLGQFKAGISFRNVVLSFVIFTHSNLGELENNSVIVGGNLLH